MRFLPPFARHTVGPLHHIGVADFAFTHALRECGEGVGDVAPHELPDHAERERALAVRDIGALDPDEREAVLLADLDGVVGVFHGFEARHAGLDGQVCFVWVLGGGCHGVGGRFVDVPPVHGARDYFVVGLEKYCAVFEIIEEAYNGWLDVEGVEPEGEDAGFALAFGVEVFDFLFFFFRDWVEAGVVVEQIGDEGKVKLWVAGYK